MEKNLDTLLTSLLSATGTEWSPQVVALVLKQLRQYNATKVRHAIENLILSAKGKITPAMLFERLPDPLGYPTTEEAWAIALQSIDEDRSVVTCDEIANALGVVWEMIPRDKFHAYKAFESAYEKNVAKAKEQNLPVRWWISYGTDKNDRERAELEAVEKQRINAIETVYIEEKKDDAEIPNRVQRLIDNITDEQKRGVK